MPHRLRRRPSVRAFAVLLAGAALGACANGPVRYGTLGNARFATVEFTRESPAPFVPLAVAGGAATDVAVVVADTGVFVVNTLVVAPIDYAGAQIRGDARPWTLWATPVMLPLAMLAYGGDRAINPATQAHQLGLREGRYGASHDDACTPPEPERPDARPPSD